MTKQVIEYGGVPVGIVVPDQGKLRFIAVKFHVHALDGERYGSPTEVVRAIHRLMAESVCITRAA